MLFRTKWSGLLKLTKCGYMVKSWFFRIFPKVTKILKNDHYGRFSTQKWYNSAEMTKKSKFSNFFQTVPDVQKLCFWAFWVPRVSEFGRCGRKIEFFEAFPRSHKRSEMMYFVILCTHSVRIWPKRSRQQSFLNLPENSRTRRDSVLSYFGLK